MSLPRYLINFDSTSLPTHFFDVVVIGSGVAGLSTAIRLGKSFRVALLTKTELSHTATRYAQGGIAAAVGVGDTPDLHYKDTIETGRGLSDPKAVRVLTNEGPECIKELAAWGVTFDREKGRFSLAREGGHSRARVVHSRDTTGSEVETNLVQIVTGLSNVSIQERVFAVDLLTEDGRCVGVLAMDSDKPLIFLTRAVVMAAGGMGQLYSTTTNPPICTGDGLAMAYRAGARLADVEFLQFHPTTLHISLSPRFLISEAVRGEGAYLRDNQGRRFMADVHPLAELAPRDVVVREMILVMRKTGQDHVYLDLTRIPEERFRHRFPAIYERLIEKGFDIARDMIPVSAAAHYMSGGIKTDLDGRTNIPGLFAVGEVAYTGVHGANRLASNSLLEGLVFSRRASRALETSLERESSKEVNPSTSSGQVFSLRYDYNRLVKKFDIHLERQELQKTMMEWVGVLRSGERLNRALDFFQSRRDLLYTRFDSPQALELQNMLTVGKLMATAAFIREESRGSHWREDFPYEDDEKWLKHITLSRDEEDIEVEIGK